MALLIKKTVSFLVETSNSKFLTFIAALAILAVSCTRNPQEIDLVNNTAHKHQAFMQILNNPQLQDEFFSELQKNKEAINRLMQNHDFTDELFNRDNMNYMWKHNPRIDTAVIDNVTTRILTDTVFKNEFNRRMESGTPTGTP